MESKQELLRLLEKTHKEKESAAGNRAAAFISQNAKEWEEWDIIVRKKAGEANNIKAKLYPVLYQHQTFRFRRRKMKNHSNPNGWREKFLSIKERVLR